MTLIQTIDFARSLVSEPLDTSRTFPDNTSSFWQDSILVTYFNQAQNEIANEIIQAHEDFFLTQTTLSITSGCSSYTLPARFVKARYVENFRNTSQPTEIFPVGITQKEDNGFPWVRGQSGVIGVFDTYYLAGNQLNLTNTPTFTDASAIRLHYIRALGDLSAGTETSDIPVEFHSILGWRLAAMMLFQQQSDTTKADLEFEKGLQRLKQYCESRQVQRLKRVIQSKRGYYG